VSKDASGYVTLALAWLIHLPLVSKLLVFFGGIFLFSGLVGLLPLRPIFSVRLMCLGLSWDYLFRFQIMGIDKVEYQDGTIERKPWIEWSRLIGGIFFFALTAAPTHYWLSIYSRLSH
jgi:hypothetical protein